MYLIREEIEKLSQQKNNEIKLPGNSTIETAVKFLIHVHRDEYILNDLNKKISYINSLTGYEMLNLDRDIYIKKHHKKNWKQDDKLFDEQVVSAHSHIEVEDYNNSEINALRMQVHHSVSVFYKIFAPKYEVVIKLCSILRNPKSDLVRFLIPHVDNLLKNLIPSGQEDKYMIIHDCPHLKINDKYTKMDVHDIIPQNNPVEKKYGDIQDYDYLDFLTAEDFKKDVKFKKIDVRKYKVISLTTMNLRLNAYLSTIIKCKKLVPCQLLSFAPLKDVPMPEFLINGS